jgi:methyl-accepting chemotaxis protein
MESDSHSTNGAGVTPTAGKLLADAAACIPVLPVLATQLREAIGQIEKGVLDISGSFEQMARRAQKAVSGASDDQGSGDRAGVEDLARATRETLGHLLQRIEHSSQLSTLTVERMQEIERRIAGLKETLRDIDDIASNARVLALNGQLEAARAGTRGAAFSVVATETAKMARAAIAASKNMRDVIASLSSDIGACSEDLRQRSSADSEMATKSRSEVDQAFDAMTVVHEGMNRAMDQTRQDCQELARDVHQAVIALQFQDSVSQRIGHVIETLEELHGSLESALAGTEFDRATGPGGAGRDWAGSMADRYTMAAEHQTLAGHAPADARAAEDLGTNVELF